MVNSVRGSQAARFSVAHELGHFLLERHVLGLGGAFTCSLNDMREIRTARLDERQEAEANAFAIRTRIPLAFLAPKLQAAILEGRQPVHLSVAQLLRDDIPMGWNEQARLFQIG